MTASVKSKKKSGRESQGAWRQDELIDGEVTLSSLKLIKTIARRHR
jgi:hypothetical protein